MNEYDLSRTLFYPSCGLNFEPLWRFSHLCDTFVYADWIYAAETVEAAVRLLRGHVELEGEPRAIWADRLDELKERPPEHHMLGGFAAHVYAAYCWDIDRVRRRLAPWACEFRLLRRFGGIERKITLLYIASEAMTVYTMVFDRRGIAPVVLYTVPQPVSIWTQRDVMGSLMQSLICRSATRPRLWGRPGPASSRSWSYNLAEKLQKGWVFDFDPALAEAMNDE